MSKGFSILNIKSARTATSTNDLSYSHLFSTDFGRILPLGVFDCVPSDKYKVSMSLFNRMAALAVPTYGRATVRNVALWVPYHMVANDVESFIAGAQYYAGQTATSRWFDAYDLYTVLAERSTAVTANDYYDFVQIESTGTKTYHRYTQFGKYTAQLLESLGYAMPQGIDLRPTSDFIKAPMKLNALRLLCFCKAYNDWFTQSCRYNTSELTQCLMQIKNKTSEGPCDSTGHIDVRGLKILLKDFTIMYDSDYFTSAWQDPGSILFGDEYNSDTMSPNLGINRINPNLLGEGIGGLSSSEPVASTTGAEVALSRNASTGVTLQHTISQKLLDLVNRFDSWLRRNNYSGSRFTEKLKSRFGIDIEDKRNEFAVILGKSESPLQIGDITATVDGQTEDGSYYPLGEYGGKGIVNDKLTFEHKAQDFGTIIVLSYITVHPYIGWQGIDRENLKVTSPTDWYQPEYDGGLPMPIAYAELAEIPTAVDGKHDGNKVFGFTERYSEYVCPLHDRITGDFKRMAHMHSWHFGRDMSYARLNEEGAQSLDVVAMGDADSYDRIFTIESAEEDHFYCTAFFDVRATRPMKSLSSKVDLGDGDMNIARNGNQMS